MRFVGIDPGRNGALVAVGDDGATATLVRHWRSQNRPPEEAWKGILADDVVVIEYPYVGRNAHSAIVLSEWIGRLLEHLPSDAEVLRPNAGAWRAKVFRRARLTRQAAKSLAVAACVQHSGIPERMARQHDIAEAWAMARYGWGFYVALAAV